MNITLAAGDGAPTITEENFGERAVLRYADPAAYARRCSADDAAVCASAVLMGLVVVSASCTQSPVHYGGPLAGGALTITYHFRSAPAVKTPPSPPTNRDAERRKDHR